MELILYKESLSLKSSYIKERVASRDQAPISKHYVIFENGQDVAFATLDEPKQKDHLCIYNLFVDPKVRRQGVATRAIRLIETSAKERNFPKIYLKPKPLDIGRRMVFHLMNLQIHVVVVGALLIVFPKIASLLGIRV
jgi:GNAT superfamily N-acetyltransferase